MLRLDVVWDGPHERSERWIVAAELRAGASEGEITHEVETCLDDPACFARCRDCRSWFAAGDMSGEGWCYPCAGRNRRSVY